jgi:rubrerythrin
LQREQEQRLKDPRELYRIAFRRRYNLSPADSRYLEMTDRAILQDHFSHQAFDKIEEEYRKECLPLCRACNLPVESPGPGNTCPACGGPLEIGDVYEDPETEELLRQELAGPVEVIE